MHSKFFRNPIVLSLLIHVVIVLVTLGLKDIDWQTQVPQEKWIEVQTQTLEEDPTKQVVQSTAGEKTDQPDAKAFYGRDNRKVDRETVAKVQKSSPTTGGAAKKMPAQARQENKAGISNPGPLAHLGVKIFPGKEKTPDEAHHWTDFSETYGEVPSDYVKGLRESEQSALNTREFVYFSYFQRIRTQLDRAWQQILRENLVRLYKNGRNLASEMDHTTRTVVTLDSKGEIVRVQVIQESGVVDLDDAAVKAFNQAGPFPNPPKEMVSSQGTIQLRWDFILKT